MNKKGFAPIIIVLIVALLVAGGITGYTLIKNKQHGGITLTTTTITKETNTTISSSVKSSEYCLDWDFFKDSKNYDDGQSHEEIKIIQEKLGVTPVGGHYGPLTKAAIDKFNKEQKIMIPAQNMGEGTISAHSPGIIGWTVSKFNDLYCSLPKPKVTITLINYPPSPSNINIETPESIGVYTYIIPNYEDFTHRIKIEPSETNITTKTIEIPYSGSIKILFGHPFTFSVYDNNILVFKMENDKIVYDLTSSIYKPYNNILYSYTGDGGFTWNGIKEDHNIKFEFAK